MSLLSESELREDLATLLRMENIECTLDTL